MGFFRPDVEPGDPQWGKLVQCENPIHNDERQQRVAKLSGLRTSDLDKRLADISENEGNRAMLQAARQIVKNPYGWLYVWGGPGNAKSEALIAIVNELNQQGRRGMYTNFTSIVNYMRDAFHEQSKGRDARNMTYIDRFNRILALPVLAIDEMDKARRTEFVEEFQFDFLNERYRQGIDGETITIFASNTDPAELPTPIYDRVRDNRFSIVENTAGSARPFMQRPVTFI